MSRNKIKVRIQNPEEDLAIETNAIIQDERILYQEPDQTKTQYSFKNNILVRENKDIRMEYTFIKKKTTEGIIYLKDYNKEIRILINTKKIDKKDNNIKIQYKVDNNEFIYEIEVIK